MQYHIIMVNVDLVLEKVQVCRRFPEKFHFIGSMNSCYRQIGNAVPVKFAKLLGEELIRLEHNGV